MLCEACDKRGVCKCLCPEMELYINQDVTEVIDTPSVYYDQDKNELRIFEAGNGKDKSFLTEQETTILRMISKGKKRRKIALSLGISIRTLETHLQNIKKKYVAHLQ